MATADSNRIVEVEYADWTQPQLFRTVDKSGNVSTRFSGLNMQLYQDGNIGPTPGPRKWATTSALTTWDFPTQGQTVWHPRSGAYLGDLFVLGATLSGAQIMPYYNFTAAEWARSANLETVDPTFSTWRDESPAEWNSEFTPNAAGYLSGAGGVQHVLSLDDRIIGGEIGLDAAGAAFSMGWLPSNSQVNWVEYRGRIYAWRGANGTNPTRVTYSDVADYKVQTNSNQFFDVGLSSSDVYIKGGWACRDAIIFCLSTDEWFSYTGVPGNATLRSIGKYTGPAHQGAGVVLENAVYFLSPLSDSVCVATPQGVDSTSLMAVTTTQESSGAPYTIGRAVSSQQWGSVYLGKLGNSSIAGDQYRAAELLNGQWTNTLFSSGSAAYGFDVCTIAYGQGYAFLLPHPTAGGGNIKFELWTRNVCLNRPSTDSDVLSAAADSNNRGTLELAPYSPGPGNEVRVKRVVMDVDRYDLGIAYGVTVSGRSGAGTLSGDPSASGRNRWVYNFEPGLFYSSEQVALTTIRGFGIERIFVEYEVRPVNHYHSDV